MFDKQDLYEKPLLNHQVYSLCCFVASYSLICILRLNLKS